MDACMQLFACMHGMQLVENLMSTNKLVVHENASQCDLLE